MPLDVSCTLKLEADCLVPRVWSIAPGVYGLPRTAGVACRYARAGWLEDSILEQASG